jgi:muconolactone delta-isomerase
MQFLSLSRRRTESFSDADFAPHAEAEAQRIREMYAEGLVRQIWRRGDVAGAAILWEVESEAEVRALVSTLPLAKLGMLELVTVVQLHPYHGFGPRK